MIGDRLREIRRHEGMSMKSLAAAAGLTTKTIFDIEHNNVSPTEDTVRRLAVALKVTLAALTEESALLDRMSGCFITLDIGDQRLLLQMCERLSLIPRIAEQSQ